MIKYGEGPDYQGGRDRGRARAGRPLLPRARLRERRAAGSRRSRPRTLQVRAGRDPAAVPDPAAVRARAHRSWLNIPHVTHDDEADITDLDAYRRELDTAAKAEGYRVTLLAFLLKASVCALREFPKFNSSLTPEKDALIYKGTTTSESPWTRPRAWWCR